MKNHTLLNSPPYILSQQEKESILIPLLNELTAHHITHCPEYAQIIHTLYQGRSIYHSLESLPYLPVNIFKEIHLASIQENSLFKTLLSSGTTGMAPSQIVLDTTTAHNQTIALASIMEDFLGKTRLPMLIIDTPHVIKDPKKFSARGAGIVGMSHFGRDHFYALDDNMQLNHKGLEEWLNIHKEQPLFLFGFTYIIWKHFLHATNAKQYDLSKSILFHSGGWKKLQDDAVDNKTFKSTLQQHFGLKRCHSFYGMVEQVGNIFVECDAGNLHCPSFADVIIRDTTTWQPAPVNTTGVVQTLSLLPSSYPGHSLLTEDLGYLTHIDTCPCRRKGKAFWIEGRVPQAEPRGCGDTYAFGKEPT